MSWSLHSLTSQEHIFIRQSVEKLRLECKVIHHAHQELPCLIVQCTERKTQHNASIQTVDGRWRSWTRTLVCSIRVCTNILSKTLMYSDTVMILRVCEVRFLNRVIRWVVPPFGKRQNVLKSKLIQNTLGERMRDSSCTNTLSPQDSTSCRSNVMRLAYLSADRIELQFASQNLARSMAEPTTADVEALKRCIRFVLKYPRWIQSFEIVPKQITCYSDSNFEHEFMQDLLRETSLEIYVNNTGGCHPLECLS